MGFWLSHHLHSGLSAPVPTPGAAPHEMSTSPPTHRAHHHPSSHPRQTRMAALPCAAPRSNGSQAGLDLGGGRGAETQPPAFILPNNSDLSVYFHSVFLGSAASSMKCFQSSLAWRRASPRLPDEWAEEEGPIPLLDTASLHKRPLLTLGLAVPTLPERICLDQHTGPRQWVDPVTSHGQQGTAVRPPLGWRHSYGHQGTAASTPRCHQCKEPVEPFQNTLFPAQSSTGRELRCCLGCLQ